MIAVVPAGLILTVSAVMIFLYRRDRRRATRNVPAPAETTVGIPLSRGGDLTGLVVAEFARQVSAWDASGGQP